MWKIDWLGAFLISAVGYFLFVANMGNSISSIGGLIVSFLSICLFVYGFWSLHTTGYQGSEAGEQD